jgi:uncharacterized membrane protein
MESDSPASEVTPAEARAALDHLDGDGVRLADAVFTPSWYHPILGLLVAGLVCAPALPPWGSLVVLAIAVLGCVLLASVYRRRSGVSTVTPTGPRSRSLLILFAAILVLAMILGAVIGFTDASPWWAVLPASVAFAAAVVLGRRYDAALRSELAGPAGERP